MAVKKDLKHDLKFSFSNFRSNIQSELASKFSGDIFVDDLSRILYARDSSIYEKTPKAVVFPKKTSDLIELVHFVDRHHLSLTPRTAGTSLAGQTIGEGIIIDQSKYMNQILEVNQEERWVRVQPGVVRDELNHFLKSYGLFFGVNTSTSNRAMIGGMVGNNSSGSLSITYGTTRENVLAIKAVLSNGEEALFESVPGFEEKKNIASLEGKLYQNIEEILEVKEHQNEIRRQFPVPEIHRRNNGYAIDLLLDNKVFNDISENEFNFCKMLVGSEGTLALFSEIKLKLHPLPPSHEILICSHFDGLKNSLEAAKVAVEHNAYSCELIDKTVLDCTKNSRLYSRDRFFVEGDPKAIIVTEFRADDKKKAEALADLFIADLKKQNLGFAYPKVFGPESQRVWSLRAAGLGLLANVSLEKDSVVSIEDTAVSVRDLPDYINELDQILRDYGQNPTYYAHAGAGEIHVRPNLNLRNKSEVVILKQLTLRTAQLVKKYRGSLSGEHGDGLIRSEFIPVVLGDLIPNWLAQIKEAWDPKNIFNPGIKVRPDAMDDSIALQKPQIPFSVNTVFDFSSKINLAHAVGKCTGSGDCRKSFLFSGVMCPSFQATKNEKDSTRGRARALAKILTEDQPEKYLEDNSSDRFASPELKEVMDLCLSCKGCTLECPSGVDLAMIKSEYLYQRRKSKKGVEFRKFTTMREKLFAYQPRMMVVARKFGGAFLSNFFFKGGSPFIKKIGGIHPKRELPKLAKTAWKKEFLRWKKKREKSNLYTKTNESKKIYLFCDEFTDQFYPEVGMATVYLLDRLGYVVEMVDHDISGRTFISKGFLMEARDCAQKNLAVFSPLIDQKIPLIGIEPSAILTFKDEYPKLLRGKSQKQAKKLAENTFLIDDFLEKIMKAGVLKKEHFEEKTGENEKQKTIYLHGHCHQKALSKLEATRKVLNLLPGVEVKMIPSGCCGMAGSFGYEKDHYGVSQKIFELALKPYLEKNYREGDVVATTGVSCREQIFDGLGIVTQHPVEILYQTLKQ